MREANRSRSSHTRPRLSLDGTWQAALDPTNLGKEARWFDATIAPGVPGRRGVPIPSCLEETWPGYDGVVWFWRTFDLDLAAADASHYHLYFGAVNYQAEVWLNGIFLGSHEGGTLFRLDASDALQDGSNLLAVRVIDPGREPVDGLAWPEVPAGREGTWFYNYGGIWQKVWLEGHPALWIEDVFARPRADLDGFIVRVAIGNASAHEHAGSVRVTIRDADGQECGAAERTIRAKVGSSVVESDLPLSAPPRHWSLESPHRYEIQVDLAGGSGSSARSDQLSVRTGLRHFTYDADRQAFLLNGAPIFLKGYLYNGYYAQTLAYPPDPAVEFAAQEVARIKQTGANLIRSFCKPLIPELLDACDEQGLLVLQESEAGWYLGLSDRLEEHFAREVTELVRRDRNHPSIIAWGTINEHAVFSLYAFSREIIQPRIWSDLDPSRMILESPVIDTPPDNEWLPAEGDLPPGRWAGFHQVHPYLSGPMIKETFDQLRTLGKPGTSLITEAPQGSAPSAHEPLPTLVSEFGSGGTPNFPRVIAEFQRRGVNELAEDYAFYRAVQDRLAAGFAKYGLGRSFASLESLLDLAQREQATRNRRKTEALRTNPNVIGYILTAFEDEGWEMNGVFDIWRQPKAAAAAMEAVNARRLTVIDADRRTAYRGDTMTIVVSAIDEAQLGTAPSGEILGKVWLEDPAGSCRWEHPVRVPSRGLRTEAGSAKIVLDGPTGPYTLRAALEGFPPAESPLLVVDPSDLPPVGRSLIWEDRGEVASTLLRERGFPAQPFEEASVLDPSQPILIASFERMTTDFSARYRRLLQWVAEGATAIFLDPRMTPQPSRYFPARWGFTMKDVATMWWSSCHYLTRHPIFDGLPQADVMDGYDAYSRVIPRRTMIWDEPPGGATLGGRPRPILEWPSGAEAVAGTFQTGLFGGQESGTWGVDLAILPYGKGRLILSTFEILENLGTDPVAEILLRNLIRFVAGSREDSADLSRRT